MLKNFNSKTAEISDTPVIMGSHDLRSSSIRDLEAAWWSSGHSHINISEGQLLIYTRMQEKLL